MKIYAITSHGFLFNSNDTIEKPLKNTSFIKTLLERRIPQILGSYFVAGTSLILFIEYLIDKYQFPSHYATLALFALIGILPSVMILSYFHGTPGKDEWTKVEKVGIPINVLFIAGILFFGDSLNIWQINTDNMMSTPQKVLIHITSLDEYSDEYFEEASDSGLIVLTNTKLDLIRENIESLLLGVYYNEKYQFIIPRSSDEVQFSDKYPILSINSQWHSNVDNNYERYGDPNQIYYVNLYQYKKTQPDLEPIYFWACADFPKMPDKGVSGTSLRHKNQNSKVIKPSNNIFEFLRGELSGWQDIGNILKIDDDILYIKLNTSNIKNNMNLSVYTNYDFKYNGVQIRIEDLKNEIEYFKKDTSSHIKTLIDNRQIELSSLEDRIKFNRTSTRVFTRGEFSYTIKIIDVRSDSIAVAKLIKLTNPYVTMRAGDKVKLRVD
jgi:hypothetical protein